MRLDCDLKYVRHVDINERNFEISQQKIPDKTNRVASDNSNYQF